VKFPKTFNELPAESASVAAELGAAVGRIMGVLEQMGVEHNSVEVVICEEQVMVHRDRDTESQRRVPGFQCDVVWMVPLNDRAEYGFNEYSGGYGCATLYFAASWTDCEDEITSPYVAVQMNSYVGVDDNTKRERIWYANAVPEFVLTPCVLATIVQGYEEMQAWYSVLDRALEVLDGVPTVGNEQ